VVGGVGDVNEREEALGDGVSNGVGSDGDVGDIAGPFIGGGVVTDKLLLILIVVITGLLLLLLRLRGGRSGRGAAMCI
jgi:hypothetical protein